MVTSWDAIFNEGREIKEVDYFVENFYKKYEPELKNSITLDLGCGTGRHAIYFAEKGLKVYALDKSKHALALLKEKIKEGYNINLVESTLDEILLPDHFLDSILSTMVLHHGTSEQIKKWLEEIKRTLKPEGLLATSVLSKNDIRYNTGIEIEPNTKIGISDTFDPEIPHHFFTKEELIYLLKNYSILEINERERYSAKGYGKFKHWDTVARLKAPQ